MATEPKPAPKTPGVVEHTAEQAATGKDAFGHPLPKTFDADEVKKHKGELKPGDLGWLKLDDKGNPVGSATKEPPDEGPAARVYVPAAVNPPEMTTPSGAPITENMNPSLPQPHSDEGMKQRNPIDGHTEPPKEVTAPNLKK